jgi:hypothetical protein
MRVFDIPAGSIPMLKTAIFSADLTNDAKYIFSKNMKYEIMQADGNSLYLFDSIIFSMNYTPQEYTEAQQAAAFINNTNISPLKCNLITKTSGQKLQQLPEGIPIFPNNIVPLSGFWWLDTPDFLQCEIVGELGTVNTQINTVRIEMCLSVYRISDAAYIKRVRGQL